MESFFERMYFDAEMFVNIKPPMEVMPKEVDVWDVIYSPNLSSFLRKGVRRQESGGKRSKYHLVTMEEK